MINRLSIFLVAALASSLSAADLCVTVSGSGSQDGSDWNNALPAEFTPVRGNTYYIADGVYGYKTWGVAASGTTYIHIKKATESSHGPATGWVDTMGDGRAEYTGWNVNSDYWDFDGQMGGGIGDWNFASGRGFYIYSVTNADRLIKVGGSGTRTGLRIRRVDMRSDGEFPTSPSDLSPVRGFQSTTNPIEDVLIQRCAFQLIQNVPIYISDSNNLTVERCYLWDNHSNATYHSEATTRNGHGTNEVWRWNFFDDIAGTAVFAGLIFNQSSVDGIEIYGNLFVDGVTPIWYYNSGATYSFMNNAKVYNNTFVVNGGPSNSQGGLKVESGTGNMARNNLFYDNVFNAFEFQNFATLTHVWAYENRRESGGTFDRDADILAAHTDGVLGTTDPFVDWDRASPLTSNYAAETPAGYDTGAELPGNDYDMFGNLRGGDGVWDRGAIEFNAIPARARRNVSSSSAPAALIAQ